ncbi:hypothetical protein [Acidaminococcus provencensis]|uniref:hypothetical protein n=1 Tax=Acidaminococcus provencensis TaxID=2058289 RepID=UPI0022E30916|nr:hypothetical protein [Acidaminococcus provencensis]
MQAVILAVVLVLGMGTLPGFPEKMQQAGGSLEMGGGRGHRERQMSGRTASVRSSCFVKREFEQSALAAWPLYVKLAKFVSQRKKSILSYNCFQIYAWYTVDNIEMVGTENFIKRDSLWYKKIKTEYSVKNNEV